jgi:hypothetical protein
MTTLLWAGDAFLLVLLAAVLLFAWWSVETDAF